MNAETRDDDPVSFHDREDADVSASLARILENESQRLDELATPAFVVDVGRARLLAANSPGARLFGITAIPSGGISLDRATPALSSLKTGSWPGRGALMFWSPAGSWTMHAQVDPVPTIGAETFRVVGTESAAADAPSQSTAPETNDHDTLVAIARRIREGLGGGLVPADPKPMVFSPAEATLQRATPIAADAAQIEGENAGEDWPGLRYMSERDIATLAHELRTPLAAIMALAEAIRDEHFGPAAARYVEYAADIHSSADHALKVLQSLLDGPPAQSHVARTDANALIGACLSALGPLAARSGVTLRPALASGLPPVLADARSLRQIVLNLVTNALKHTPRGGEVTVTTAYRVDGPVRIEVRDTGSGISVEDLASIESEIEADRNGLPPSSTAGGLGLPLVRRMAADNGAEFGIDSRPGQGTRVFLTFGRDRVADGPSS